jgi:hypothetical protein
MTNKEINYDIVNYKKFYWYDTQAYKFYGDDNKGYIHGFVEWYGNQRLDDACDIDDGSLGQWSWFKTVEERDKEFNKWNKEEA